MNDLKFKKGEILIFNCYGFLPKSLLVVVKAYRIKHRLSFADKIEHCIEYKVKPFTFNTGTLFKSSFWAEEDRLKKRC